MHYASIEAIANYKKLKMFHDKYDAIFHTRTQEIAKNVLCWYDYFSLSGSIRVYVHIVRFLFGQTRYF